MLRALGGTEITIMFPLVTLPNDPSAQLGLVDPGVDQVEFSPVVVRILPTSGTGPRRRLEFLVSSSAVDDELASRNMISAEGLFATALGVLYQGDLLHIENVTSEFFADSPYLCRILAVE